MSFIRWLRLMFKPRTDRATKRFRRDLAKLRAVVLTQRKHLARHQ